MQSSFIFMMFHRLTVYLICFAMTGMSVIPHPAYAVERPAMIASSEAELLEKYPDAKVIRVSPDEYPILEKKLHQQGYKQSETLSLQLAQNDRANDKRNGKQSDALDTGQQQGASPSRGECEEPGGQSSSEKSLRVMVDFTEDMMNSSGNTSSDDAAVVFVVIGAVVLVVWTLYVFKYFYDVSVGIVPCGRWNELTVVTSVTSTSDEQHARFNGLRYSTGFRDGPTDVGISFELGKTDILLKEVGALELKGGYWLLGPMLRWRISQGLNPSYFQMNFIAGTTEHSEVGVLAKASLGVLFGIGESMQLGLNWGAMNINLNGDQGIITDHSQYHYLYDINVGFRF
jgi:hypothetical protein